MTNKRLAKKQTPQGDVSFETAEKPDEIAQSKQQEQAEFDLERPTYRFYKATESDGPDALDSECEERQKLPEQNNQKPISSQKIDISNLASFQTALKSDKKKSARNKGKKAKHVKTISKTKPIIPAMPLPQFDGDHTIDNTLRAQIRSTFVELESFFTKVNIFGEDEN